MWAWIDILSFVIFYIGNLPQGASTLDNVDEWEWKLSMLLRNEREQEVVSRERKDRRDYEHLATLAERMGLYR